MTLMKLRHLADIRNSNVDKVIAEDELPVRLCNYVDVYKNDFITADLEFNAGSATADEIERFQVKKGDVIITKDSEDRHDIGIPAFVRETADDIVCGYHLTMLRAFEKRTNAAFLFWALQSKVAKEAFAIAANGVTRYGLTQEGIKGLQLWLPDLSAQKRIAAFLDRETARIDELIAKKGGLVYSLKAKLKRAISAAVTDGLNADVPVMDSGIDWIGKIPAHWRLMKLGYLGRCANGINIGGDAFGSGYPFVSYGDVYKNRELPISVTGLVQSTEADRKGYSVISGDVLFTRTSETIEEVGFSSVCMTTIEDAVFAGFLIRFRPDKNQLSPLFSKYAFQHMGLRDYFAKEMNLITRASLSQDLLRNMPVPLPPLEEQQAIGEHLGRLERQIEAIIEKTLETISKLKERRAALITAAVTGKIDVDTYCKAGATSATLDRIEKELQE